MTRRGLCANVFSNPIRALILLDADFGYKVDRLSLGYSSQWIAIILSLYGGIFVMGRKNACSFGTDSDRTFRDKVRERNCFSVCCTYLLLPAPPKKKKIEWRSRKFVISRPIRCMANVDRLIFFLYTKHGEFHWLFFYTFGVRRRNIISSSFILWCVFPSWFQVEPPERPFFSTILSPNAFV